MISPDSVYATSKPACYSWLVTYKLAVGGALFCIAKARELQDE